MIRPWYPQVVRLTLHKIFTYRAEFWLNFLLYVGGNFLVAYFLWTSIYETSGKEEIGGFKLDAMIFYFLLAPMTIRSVMGPQMSYISREIYEGNLTKYLLYPLEYFEFKLIEHLSFCSFYFVQQILAMILFISILGLPEGIQLSFSQLIFFFVTIFMGSFLYFFMASCLECVAFYADNVWSLLVFLRFVIYLLGGTYLPLSLYPSWAQEIIQFLPFYALVGKPIELFLSPVSWTIFTQGFFVSIAWIVFFYWQLRNIWSRGLRQYAGVGI